MDHSTPTDPAFPDRFAALLRFFPEDLVRQAVRATRLGGALRLPQLPEAPPAGAGAGLAARYERLREEVGRQRLRPRRHRICPRVVKAGRNKFPVKKQQHRCPTTQPF